MTSKEAERHLGAMCMALKRALLNTNPLAPKPKLGPEAMECLREGNWEGVAVAYLHDMAYGRHVSIGKEAFDHFYAWASLEDVSRPRFMQELIQVLNKNVEKWTALAEARERPLNRAERRAMGRR